MATFQGTRLEAMQLLYMCIEIMIVTFSPQNMITEATLREALNSNLEGKPEDQLQALVSTANKVATTQSGMLDYIKLLSPVS